jgi:hypothetical protein
LNEKARQQIFNHRNTLGVIIMVSHFANISEISGISLESGEAVVMQANQQGDLEWVRLPFQGVLIAWAWWYTREPDKQPGASFLSRRFAPILDHNAN